MTVSYSRLSTVGAAVLLLSFSACGGSNSDGTAAAVDLGPAGNFVILAKSGVTAVPPVAITGNIGVSPIAYDAIVGFSLVPEVPDAFTVSSTSAQVTGLLYASDYVLPTPANLTAAVGAMELAYTDAAGRAADVTELGAGEIGGMTLAPGVYKWGTGLGITTNVTLNGSSTGVWIFQVSDSLTVADGARVILGGEARAENITWQVAGGVTLGTTAHLEGIVLCQTAISLNTGASVNGRLLAQTAVSLDGNAVVQPAP